MSKIDIDGIIWCDLYFNWSHKEKGFGQISFEKHPDKTILCLNECLSKESVREIMHEFVDYLMDNCELADKPFGD